MIGAGSGPVEQEAEGVGGRLRRSAGGERALENFRGGHGADIPAEYQAILHVVHEPGVNVIGGTEKLFHKFVKEHIPKSIVSYCDRSKFTGDVYKRLGMSLSSTSSPVRHWYSYRKSEKMQHITDNFLRQRGFDQIFGTSYGKGTSNEELMLERGYLPVYDCGQFTFTWKYDI